MNKLFNFAQPKGKWHKFLSFNLGGGAKLYKNFAKKLLAVSLCMAMVLLGAPLGGQGVHVVEAAAEPTRTETPITVPEANLDATGNDKTKWKNNNGVYETQNQGDNENACTMDVPVEVTAGYAELEFEWTMSGDVGSAFLRFELKDAGTGDVLQSNQKSREENEFDKVVLKLDKGTYTLTFTCRDAEYFPHRATTGYVKSLNLVTYSGVSAISKTMFLTKEALLELCAETNVVDGKPTGLLATGTGTDVTLRINFGQRPEAANYYKDFDSASDTATDGTAAEGPTTWLVAGSEKFTPAGGTETDGLVLFSEEPLVSSYELRDASSKMNTKFQPTYYTDRRAEDPRAWTYWVGTSTGETAFDDGWGTYPDADADGTPDNPDYVYANHWGASNLRQVLTAIYNGSTLTVDNEEADYAGFFNATETGLVAASEIRTVDDRPDSLVEYTTTDYLYAPFYTDPNDKRVTVGGADSLTIDIAHWGGWSWLRSPHPGRGREALFVLPGHDVGLDSYNYVHSGGPSISAAFRLNLSSVLFTSAASAASSATGGSFESISVDTPMTLRVHKYLPDFTGTATLNDAKDTITVNNAAAGDVLMVQGVTDEGENWSYSKTMDSTGLATVTAGDVVAAGASEITGFALSDFSSCNIWLERTTGEDGCTVTYASTPIVAGATDPATWGSAVTRGNIPHWVAADGTTSVQVPAGNGIIWLKEDSDGTSAWYGLDNSAGVFAEGSRFWVRWLSKQSDPTLWQYYYDMFDTEHKTDVESDNLWIFLIGVTAPDGTEYTDFGTQVPLYIQKDPDWDGNDIRSVFISGASDEVLLSHFHGTMDYPESALYPAAEFYKIMLSHFSPYAIFNELTDEEKAALTPTPNDNNNQTTDKPNSSGTDLPGTGDISTELLISGLAIVLVSSLGVMLRLITSKKKFEE